MDKKAQKKQILEEERLQRAYKIYRVKCLMNYSTKAAGKHIGFKRYMIQDCSKLIDNNRAFFLQRLAEQIKNRGAATMIKEQKKEQADKEDIPIKRKCNLITSSISNEEGSSSSSEKSFARKKFDHLQRFQKLTKQFFSNQCEQNTVDQIDIILSKSLQIISQSKGSSKEQTREQTQKEICRNIFQYEKQLDLEQTRKIKFYINSASQSPSRTSEETDDYSQGQEQFSIPYHQLVGQLCFTPRYFQEVQKDSESELEYRMINRYREENDDDK